MDNILASIIVCTYNRSDLLFDTLISLTRQSVPAEKYEILVIDNASTDNTSFIVQELIQKHRNLRYVYEPEQGLSFARNRGVIEAAASIVVYIDDDAIAQYHWLENVLRSFNCDPRPACVGGRVYLRWEGGKRPSWIPDELLPAYGFLDMGDEPGPLQHANGLNMAFSKEVIVQLGGFATSIGRIGRKLIAGEESDLQLQIRIAGFPIRYEPNAIVEHWIPLPRQSPEYLYNIFYNLGVTDSLRRRLHFSVTRLDSFKLIVRSIENLVLVTRRLLTDLRNGKDKSHCKYIWNCELRKVLGFVIQELSLFGR